MVNIERLRAYYLSLPFVTESFPFDSETLVFKVGSRMFGYIPLERERPYVCLKCDPERAIDLRERYVAVEPAFHMNKVHWNGVYLDSDLSMAQILDLLQHSYDLVWGKMPKREREALLASQQSM